MEERQGSQPQPVEHTTGYVLTSGKEQRFCFFACRVQIQSHSIRNRTHKTEARLVQDRSHKICLFLDLFSHTLNWHPLTFTLFFFVSIHSATSITSTWRLLRNTSVLDATGSHRHSPGVPTDSPPLELITPSLSTTLW